MLRNGFNFGGEQSGRLADSRPHERIGRVEPRDACAYIAERHLLGREPRPFTEWAARNIAAFS